MAKGRYKHEVPLDLNAALPDCAKSAPVEPVKRAKYHGDDCFCLGCADMRAAVEIYIEQKRLFDINGFN